MSHRACTPGHCEPSHRSRRGARGDHRSTRRHRGLPAGL